ncbi:MAG: MFS transporter [Candidatus Heimdallarchaeota archaeon]|nr:MFS transporter [Candidatus Heimdallarchaeota archaeon]MCK5049333.1 MFS transporter [Candidatus Heimdallarchaeota archaeon]
MSNITEDPELEKLNYTKTYAIGLAFLTVSMFWAHYNGFVQAYLKDTYELSYTMIGFVMTIDNYIAFFLQPWIGAKSDNTKTRFGKRMPYIMVGVPLAAIFFALIPVMDGQALWLFIGTLVLFNLSMAIYRSPAVALMPDLTKSKHRSKANGIINLMGGVGAAVMLLLGAAVHKVSPELSFLMGSLIAVLSLVLLFVMVKEPEVSEKEEKKEVVSLREEAKKVFKNEDKSQLIMFFAIASWFMAWNAIESHWTNFLHEMLDIPKEDAQSALFFFSLMFILSAFPGGWLGAKYGRIPTMKVGLLMFVIILAVGNTLTTLGGYKIMLAFAGIAWGLVNINSIVVVWEHSKRNLGAGTGLYYAFASLAAVTGPPLAGVFLDIDVALLIPFSTFFLEVAFVLMFFVKTGEVGDIELDN